MPDATGGAEPAVPSEAIRAGMADGETPTAIAARLAERSGWPRREIYRLSLEREQKRMQ